MLYIGALVPRRRLLPCGVCCLVPPLRPALSLPPPALPALLPPLRLLPWLPPAPPWLPRAPAPAACARPLPAAAACCCLLLPAAACCCLPLSLPVPQRLPYAYGKLLTDILPEKEFWAETALFSFFHTHIPTLSRQFQ